MAASIVFDPRWQVLDTNGNPVAGAKLATKFAGTSTNQAVYTDSALTVAHANPVVADAAGRLPLMFMSPSSYKLLCYTSADVEIWSADNYVSPSYFAENFGTVMAVGSRNVTSGYTLLLTDRLVTVASSGATTFNLLAASLFTMDVTIKNMLTGTVVIKASGADLIDGIPGSPSQFTLEAAATPLFPAVTLRPITGGWYIVSSHRAA